ncbi:hypothetical protein [Salarchaeum sp. JOR-1]|uniref:hypothetical protein n=1 Tax=Salarchaeum sp. JOR-1 TaxID=2599399 RepID=UPI001198791B|nr:hypothetical protein [Salarchaeum sp. JOR-1]QDX39542.1 hypothetical protein FQU85_01050 [Salarchaeum sp. JOR-1]
MTDETSMHEISHTHTDTAHSRRRLYARGETVAADGGRRDATDERGQGEMADVTHSTREEPNRVFERGGEFEDE